jgi:hypothetical protein
VFFRKFGEIFKTFVSSLVVVAGIADPDPSDPYVFFFFALPDPDPLVRGMDPDPSIIKQK